MKEQKMRNRRIRRDSGFTLVELIVVLAIISILSTAAVFSVIGYIDRSRFDKNEQNAESVYQAVQTALGRDKIAGRTEDWVRNVLLVTGRKDPYSISNHDEDSAGNILDDCYDVTAFENFNENRNSIGDSVHMRYTLTYEKDGGSENDAVLDLVGGYFYDTSVLDATFTIEFDVEKVIGTDGKVHYSVNAYSVFYDERRSGWDKKAMNDLEEEVPFRSSTYRENTSLVGYYNGGNPSAVDSVYTPAVNNKMEYAELSLRNGETLDLTFSVVKGAEQVTGTGKYSIHYTASLYDAYAEEKFADLVISEASLTTGVPRGSEPQDYADILRFDPATQDIYDGKISEVAVDGKNYPVLYTVDRLQDDAEQFYTRYKASIRSSALVYVHKGKEDFDYNALNASALSGEGDFYVFPLTVSYVIREDDAGKKNYVSYSISLDAMMSRPAVNQYEKNRASELWGKTYSGSIIRLFPDAEISADFRSGDTRLDGQVPKNIYVSMTASVDAFTDPALAPYNETDNLPASEATKAKRAYDDCVYRLENGTYAYRENAALGDAAGYAVVNTFFGDLEAGSYGNRFENGAEACITSFRHLYNMRFTTAVEKETEYTIRRDLDWFVKKDDRFSSEVVVYGFDEDNAWKGFSPTGDNRKYVSASELALVSWPALPTLTRNQILIAAENSISSAEGDRTAVIRNVQIRRNSFIATDAYDKKGLGFICVNNGSLRNIRCENLCLTMDASPDGTANMLSYVNSAVSALVQHGNDNKANRPGGFAEVPVGGLIGLNSYIVGDKTAAAAENTICMSNTVVLTGEWSGSSWTLYKFKSTGGVIGENATTAQTGGEIRTTGGFAVSGYGNVGGVIGAGYAAVDALLAADSTVDADKSVYHSEGVRALVMGRSLVGGVAGYTKAAAFAQNVAVLSGSADTEGAVTITEPENARYAIEVDLAEGSYIWQFGTESSEGVGGAVGVVENYPADKILSVKSCNAGTILCGTSNGANVSGGVGMLKGGSAAAIYVHAENSGNIGTLDGTAPVGNGIRAALGIAYMNDRFSAPAGADYIFTTENSGNLFCNIKGTNGGGAGQAIGSCNVDASSAFCIRSVNRGQIRGENSSHDQSGVGGAIGYIRSLQTSHIYAELVSGSAISSNSNNVGGAVGATFQPSSGRSAAELLTITAVLQADTEIRADGLYIGGCVGDMMRQGEHSILRTKVQGNSAVIGNKNVGGVAGRLQQYGSGTDISVCLQGDAAAPTLTVTGIRSGAITKDNVNVGGVIGESAVENGQYSTGIVFPGQDSTEKLVLDIDGGNRTGGLIGYFNLRDLQKKQDNGVEPGMSYSLSLLPETSITGADQFVGGAIGFIEGNSGGYAEFSAAVTVNILAGAASETPVVTGRSDIGGAIGSMKIRAMSGTVNTLIERENAVRSREGNAGGAIGSTENFAAEKAGYVRAVLRASSAVAAEKDSGGCIGVAKGSSSIAVAEAVLEAEYAVYVKTNGGGCIGVIKGTSSMGSARAILGREDELADYTPIYGSSSDLGGCLGRMFETGTISEAETVVNTSACIIADSAATGSGIGGVVGHAYENSAVGKVTLSGLSEQMLLNQPNAGKVGGLVGYLEGNLNGKIPHVNDFSVSTKISVTGKSEAGGCFGSIRNGVAGTAGETPFVLSNGVSVTNMTNGSNFISGGTGGFAATVTEDSVINCAVELTLPSGSVIRGGFNTGGMIGLVSRSILKGNMTVHLAGGHIMSDGGGLGGVLGSLQGNKTEGATSCKNLTTYLDGRYSTDDASGTPIRAISKNEGTGIGGVIGQFGGGSRNSEEQRQHYIDVGSVMLYLSNDFGIHMGYSSLGGVIGQCESLNATIQNLEIRSADGGRHSVYVQPPSTRETMDVGGIIGNMLGQLKGSISADNTDFYIYGDHYIGGWIGALDGQLGTESRAYTMNVSGIRKVEGRGRGVGGVIGATGAWRGVVKLYNNINVDLQDAQIISRGRNYPQGTGGVVGLMGDPNGAIQTGSYDSALYGNIEVTMSGSTSITGNINVGGVIGYLRTGSNVSKGSSYTLHVSGSPSITAAKGNGSGDQYVANAGGVIGMNEASILADIDVHVSGGTLTITASGGNAGSIMGKNTNVFGRNDDTNYTLPEGGGKIDIYGSMTGAVLGYNSSDGKCGAFSVDGSHADETDDMVVYRVENVELHGEYDKTSPRVAFVGKNNKGTINNVEVNSSYDPDRPLSATASAPALSTASAPALTASAVPAAAQPAEDVAGPADTDGAAAADAAEDGGGAADAGDPDEAEDPDNNDDGGDNDDNEDNEDNEIEDPDDTDAPAGADAGDSDPADVDDPVSDDDEDDAADPDGDGDDQGDDPADAAPAGGSDEEEEEEEEP